MYSVTPVFKAQIEVYVRLWIISAYDQRFITYDFLSCAFVDDQNRKDLPDSIPTVTVFGNIEYRTPTS